MKSEIDLALQLTNAFYKKENKSRRHLNFENDCPKKQLQKQKKRKENVMLTKAKFLVVWTIKKTDLEAD